MSQTKMGAHVMKSSTGEDGFLPSQKDINLFEMIDMIIKKNLPLSIVKDMDFRSVMVLFPCYYEKITNYVLTCN